MWEQRYGALQPSRSGGNTRYYDNTQLRRLLNIVSLSEAGYKISELGVMSDRQLFNLLKEISSAETANRTLNNFFINQLIAAAMEYDEPGFEKVFAHCFLHYGLKNTFRNILYPVLTRLGLMWAYNELPPAQEHFLSNLIRQKLFTAIDSLSLPLNVTDKWLLFLPEGELHDIGLLLAHFFIKQAGQSSVLIGSNLPASSLDNAVQAIKPRQLLFFIVHNDLAENLQQYVHQLARKYSRLKIYVVGAPQLLSFLTPDRNVKVLHSMDDLEQQLYS